MSESSGPSVNDVMNAESVADIAPAVVEETAEPEVAEPEVAEPEVAEPEPEPEVAEPEAPSTQEVVQNVQEMLSSTDTSGSVNELENRVKVLELTVISLVGKILNKEKISPTIISQISP